MQLEKHEWKDIVEIFNIICPVIIMHGYYLGHIFFRFEYNEEAGIVPIMGITRDSRRWLIYLDFKNIIEDNCNLFYNKPYWAKLFFMLIGDKNV